MFTTKFSKIESSDFKIIKKKAEEFKNFIKDVEKSKKADKFNLLEEFHYLLLKSIQNFLINRRWILLYINHFTFARMSFWLLEVSEMSEG